MSFTYGLPSSRAIAQKGHIERNPLIPCGIEIDAHDVTVLSEAI